MLNKHSVVALLACMVTGQANYWNGGGTEYCNKDSPNCTDPTDLCAPPDNGNENSPWVCYECWCNVTAQCYRDDCVTKCNCTGYEGFGSYCNETGCNPDYCLYGGVCNPENNTCTCQTDFWGTHCENQYLPCNDEPDPCNNNGDCYDLDGEDQYSCECFKGWNGEHCENNIDDCISNPCTDTEICVDEVDGYICVTKCSPGHCSFGGVCNPEDNTCTCYTDFWGPHCENQYLPCNDEPDPCNNNGDCYDLDGEDQYSCECFKGWNGEHCENNVDDCISNPCTDTEICVDKVDGYVCVPSCEYHNPCENGGTCSNGENGPFCICPPCYTGIYCNEAVDPCSEQPCLNGGTCVCNGNGGYSCICPQGYTGDLCETPVDPCSEQPCLNGGTCVCNGNGGYSCICPQGYTGDLCETPVDPCSEQPCLNGGTCVCNGNGGYSCICPQGYTGDLCETPVDPCYDQPCLNGGTCESNGHDGYSCVCPQGYTGDLCERKECPPCECQPRYTDRCFEITINVNTKCAGQGRNGKSTSYKYDCQQ